MFGSSILDVAVGLMFVYLLLSLICTAIQEAIATWLNQRGKGLFQGIKNLLNDPTFTGLAQQVYNHGLVDGISKDASAGGKTARLPSYMPAATFSLALVDILSARGAVAAVHGEQLMTAEIAEDSLQKASQGKDEEKVKQATQARDQAQAELERMAAEANAAATQAEQAQAANPGGADVVQAVANARDTANSADAAVKILKARRAAIESAGSPKNAALVQEAADAVEQALAAGRALAAQGGDPLATMQHAIELLPGGHTKETLLVLVDKTRREVTPAEHHLVTFQRNIENWFNDAMAQVSGWYKRWTQQVLLGLTIVVVLAANADSVKLVRRLASDGPLRASLVTAADRAVAAQHGNSEAETTNIKQAVLREAQAIELPLGWTVVPWSQPFDAVAVTMKVIGLLISIFAVSLGAPFWFDTLSKVTNIRGAGTPPGQSAKSRTPQK
jgi:hypothetical protein